MEIISQFLDVKPSSESEYEDILNYPERIFNCDESASCFVQNLEKF